SADYERERERGGNGDGQHLAFSWSDASAGREGGVSPPRSGAVDELCGVEDATGGVDFDGGAGRSRGENPGVGFEVDGARADCGKKRSGEIARVEAVLVEEGEMKVMGCERRKNLAESFGRERVGRRTCLRL